MCKYFLGGYIAFVDFDGKASAKHHGATGLQQAIGERKGPVFMRLANLAEAPGRSNKKLQAVFQLGSFSLAKSIRRVT